MTLNAADAAKVAGCAANLWRDGQAARTHPRGGNTTTTTSAATRDACRKMGPDPGTSPTATFVGARARLSKPPYNDLLEGAAPVGHDVDCVSPGKPKPHYYTCPQAVDATTLAKAVPGTPGPPSDAKKPNPGAGGGKKKGRRGPG